MEAAAGIARPAHGGRTCDASIPQAQSRARHRKVDAASGAALEVGIGVEFPTLKKTSLVELELPTTLLLTVPPAIAAVVGMFKLDGWPFYLSAFAGVWLGFGSVFKVLQARAKDRKLAELRGPERLRGCLYVMHAAAIAARGLSPKKEEDREVLRVTIHKADGEELVQLLDYTGGTPEHRKGIGRRRSCRSGVIGRAYTSAEPAYFRREDDDFEKYKREMRERWHMLPSETDGLDSDRRAHVAVPIGDDGKVAAVVFLDSSDRDFFTASIQDMIVAHCIGLAQYVQTS